MEHNRPIYAMGRNQNVFPYDLRFRWPEIAKLRQARVIPQITSECRVVQQGVKPDVGHEIRIKREFYPPRQTGSRPGHREIARDPVDRVQQLSPSKCRNDKIRPTLDETLQPILVLRQLEIPVLFFKENHFAPFRAKLSIRVTLFVR